MGARRIRREQRRVDMDLSRRTNGMRKMDERERRHARLRDLLQKGKLPYTPTIMSWLSAALDKPASRITQADVEAVLKAKT
ncbi:MAG TPA: hypothetical protein VMS17_19335 [Gemmataceae bacterium]|nr:hypothetical protein [Gemmataceae bacterium]